MPKVNIEPMSEEEQKQAKSVCDARDGADDEGER